MIAGFDLCVAVFKEAETAHPDLMEPYATRLAGVDDAEQILKIMREGLAATFRRRYPMPESAWPKDQIAAPELTERN